MRICDLALQLEESEVGSRVQMLYGELQYKGLKFKPEVYFGDEWFSPEGAVAISIPFWLAHPRLIELEEKMMLEVEGGSLEWFLKLIRHEAGHCFDHAYGFSKRKRWRELFGSPEQEYHPEMYRPRPYSRSFVQNLDNWYAQAHPDEDFAETFAVWVDPGRDWRREYTKSKVVLEKLEYINSLAKGEVKEKFKGRTRHQPYSAARMKITLGKYYAKRKKEHAEDYPDFYDPDLRRIFNGDPALKKSENAAALFMKKRKKLLLDSVAWWAGERKVTVEQLMKKLTERCAKLGLRTGTDDDRTQVELTAYLSSLVSNYLFTGKFKRRV